MTRHDFGDGLGSILAHTHLNGGGWVADTARVAPGCFVGRDATVIGRSKVTDNVRVEGSASAREDSMLAGNVRIYDNVIVGGRSRLWGDVEVGGSVVILDDVRVTGDIKLGRGVKLTGDGTVMPAVAKRHIDRKPPPLTDPGMRSMVDKELAKLRARLFITLDELDAHAYTGVDLRMRLRGLRDTIIYDQPSYDVLNAVRNWMDYEVEGSEGQSELASSIVSTVESMVALSLGHG